MSERVDTVVIGAGVVGLAVARAFARSGRETILLEKNERIGEETSSRNSEVVHAGLYYRNGGMRAKMCVPGKKLLYAFCEQHGVNHERCEKLIVAHGSDEIEKLSALKTHSERNGVMDLRIIDSAEASRLEPGLACDAAILSPSSGIVDSHGLMLALLGDFEEAGGVLAVRASIDAGRAGEDGIALSVGGEAPMELEANLVINSAGLWADRIARKIDTVPRETIPKIHYGKGQYFSYAGKAPFSRLVYPLPGPDSLGAHYTRDLGGQAKLGPDISYVSSNEDYDVDAGRRDAFARSVQRFWPSLDPEKLSPGYAGIRPKSAGPGEEGDFIMQGPKTHGVPGYIGLYGMESPALTSCLAIAEHVLTLAE
ncbi:MAG: NAD(P)/FAD-dependent oxidoreductase [Pseudomonadota bacterium]